LIGLTNSPADFFREVTQRVNLILEGQKHLCIEIKSDKSASLASPKALLLPTGVALTSNKYLDLIRYLVILHFKRWPKLSLKTYLHLEFEDQLEENPEFFWMQVLTDRALFIKWLDISETISLRMFFGGILETEAFLKTYLGIVLKFEREMLQPARTERVRGYRDKGTLPDYSHKMRLKGISEDHWVTQLQNYLEEKYHYRQEEKSLFRDILIFGGREYDHQQLIKFRIKKGNIINEREKEEKPSFQGREIETQSRTIRDTQEQTYIPWRPDPNIGGGSEKRWNKNTLSFELTPKE